MRLQAIGKSLVVQIKAEEKKSVVIVPRQNDEPMQAIVKSVGDKVESPIKEGDLVLLFPYAGSKVQGGSETEPYMLIAEKEIVGILRED